MSDEIQAHSAADDEDAPCGVQLGKINVSPDEVIAHSAAAREVSPICIVNMVDADEEPGPDDVIAHSATQDEDAPCVVQLGKSNAAPEEAVGSSGCVIQLND